MVDFKHITVTADEEEDVVVKAGLGASESAHLVAEDTPPSEDEPPTLPSEPETPAERPRTAEAKPARAKKDDEYRPTTLDDLKGEKMSLTQRIVIIAAIVCIIGAVVYYFGFMR